MVSYGTPGRSAGTIAYALIRPKSKNATWEEPPQEGEAFNYDAQPDKYYFEVESIGNLEPDAVIQQGIKVMQQKLAAVIQELTGDEGRNGDGYGGGLRSPDGMNGGGGGDYGMDPGTVNPYANGGNTAWGGASAYDRGGERTPFGGGATPFGATPYGQTGWAA